MAYAHQTWDASVKALDAVQKREALAEAQASLRCVDYATGVEVRPISKGSICLSVLLSFGCKLFFQLCIIMYHA